MLRAWMIDQATPLSRATRWMTWSPPGGPNGPTWTLSRSRCSAGSPGWPGTWTWPGASAFAAHGLETWGFDVLSALRRKGPPYQLTPGALLRATLVTSGTMTNRVDRLAAAGLVRRDPDPQDRRGVLVTLTPAGRARVNAALDDLVKHEQALLDGLSPADRATLAGLLRVLLAPLDA